LPLEVWANQQKSRVRVRAKGYDSLTFTYLPKSKNFYKIGEECWESENLMKVRYLDEVYIETIRS
jgi:hypothetical protein